MTKSCAALVFGLFGIASQLSATPAQPRLVCPTIYQPATCTYGEFSAEGTNKCLARGALVNTLEREGVEYDPAGIRCDLTDGPLSRGAEGEIAE